MTINSIQKNVIFNYNVLPNYNKSIFYGYSSILKEPESIEIFDYILFLCKIGIVIQFLPSNTIDDLILQKLYSLSPIIKNKVLSLQIIAENVKILLPKILEEVHLSGNIDLIFWYQSIVFNAIMKQICAKTKIWLLSKNCDDLKMTFEFIFFIFSESQNLPSNLIMCFKELMSKNKNDIEADIMINVLNDYIESNVFDLNFAFPNVNIILGPNN